MKYRRLGRWASLAPLVLAILACNPLASASNQSGDSQLATQQAQAAQTAALDGNNPSTAPTPEPTVSASGRLGERVSAKTVAITVSNIETSQGTNDVKPESGKIFIILHLNVENLNDAMGLDVDSGDLQIRNDAGDTVDSFPQTITSDQIDDLDLAPTEKATGTVVFQIPANDKGLHLLYDFNEKHIDIDLGR